MSNPTQVALAEAAAVHAQANADYYRRLAVVLSDALWDIVLALHLPPQPEAELAGKPVVFGIYDADVIVERVRELAQAPLKGVVSEPPQADLAPWERQLHQAITTAPLPTGENADEPQEAPAQG